jgi:N,N'-diacetyllegionaminate synthase
MHKGSVSLAVEYARVFKEAGADILKMQFGHKPDDPVRYVSLDMAETVARYCKLIGLELMASIFSREGLLLARHVEMKRYKLAHKGAFEKHGGSDSLIAEVLAEGKETFITTDDPAAYQGIGQVKMIFTTPKYPTMPWELRMPNFRDGVVVWADYYGYSDHTHGIGACLLAVANGARYVEKHVALDSSDLWTKDTSFSATPAAFHDLVRYGREIERAS